MDDEYKPVEWPAWRHHIGQFGRLESKIFDQPEDVPEGWVAKAEDAKPKRAPAKKRAKRANAKA